MGRRRRIQPLPEKMQLLSTFVAYDPPCDHPYFAASRPLCQRLSLQPEPKRAVFHRSVRDNISFVNVNQFPLRSYHLMSRVEAGRFLLLSDPLHEKASTVPPSPCLSLFM